MIKKILIISILSSIFILPSCTNRRHIKKRHSRNSLRHNRIQSGPRPDWVDYNSSEFPKSEYLTGVGYSKNRRNAEANAKA